MIYVIGDVHGHDDKLADALDWILDRRIDGDTTVCIGDYIDRGPGSRQVVERLREWETKSPGHSVFLRGNHEQMLLDARDHPEDDDWLYLWWSNGGLTTARSYGATVRTVMTTIPPTDWDFFERTEMEYVEGGYHFVHAGLVPEGCDWDEPGVDPRLWIREEFIDSDDDFGGRIVVVGHTPQRTGRPLVLPNKVGIDTAVAYGGPLSVLVLDPEAAGENRLRFGFHQF